MLNRNSPQHKMEKSGCLMSIVVTLSSSSDFEQREKEKTRNEKAFSESNKKLGELISTHQEEVNKIVQAFGAMTKSINESRTKIHKIKRDLNSCKSLLHFKRDELRKLWRDGVEHKTVLAMFDQIEQIKEVPDKMDELESQKYYLHATELVVNSVARLEGSLSNVDALRDLRAELNSRKERLHEIIIDELNRQIYDKSGKQPSLRRGSKTVLKDGSLKRSGVNFGRDSPTSFCREESDLDLKEVSEDLHANPEENQPHFITVLIESLSVLRKLPEAVEAIKMKIHPELLSLIAKSSLQIVESAGETLSSQNQPRYLHELLEVIFQQFRNVASMHTLVLRNVHRAMASGMPMRSDLMYDMKDVWVEFQAVLQVLLGEYLDVKNTLSSRQQAPSGFDEPSMDIGMYFSKKRLPRPKKISLFRFDASLHALSTNSYNDNSRRYDRTELFGGKGLLGGLGKHQLVCKPDANNITLIYKPLRTFIQEIEAAMETAPGLQEYITDFVENAFLGQVHQKVSRSIDAATRVIEEEDSQHKCFDALRNVIDEKSRRELGIPRPLLQSTVTVDKNIEELQGLMHDLPDYADQFLNMICNVLRDYRDKCHSAYRDIVQHGSDEKRVISALWAKDEDISRFLRSLPSWRSLHQAETELNQTVCSEAELRVLSVKEVTILISNLSSDESLIPQHEIITDITQMRTIANVHESLEWFAGRLQHFADSLSSRTAGANALSVPLPDPFVLSEIPPVSDKALQSLRSLVQDFRDLAEICLLLLHLEIRVHCFYYLLPVAKQSNYAGPIDDLDPDSNVLKLNKDLTGMEEVLTQSLQPKKFRYIFESLGYLVSSIIITSIQFLKKINENGIKKMCRNILAIQQNLTNITLTREADLDRARQFYELLYLTPEDILNTIAEKGVQFSFLEYSQLLQLYHRSHTGISAEKQKEHVERLRQIIDKGTKSK
ncbi:exocyst complex component 4-like isoform X2 [Gigantopelta aegis]|uniref:exocyst complex component 4-like isoform X2 n=1 Tax=Gigantopelta aegis TaxID=1735272 RepID=UPI001B88CD05|nr:exocyst complex component 4-like isoform X2 [Gigantopelta aegis]